jgi:GntR family transcriptional regulator
MEEPTKYREVAADLQAKIEAGELPPGEKLPSDAELGEIYDASRNTVREAVRFLMTRRLVEKQGTRGTFVLRKIDPFSTVVSVTAGFGGQEGATYASDTIPQDRTVSVTTPRVEIQEAPTDIAADLELTDDLTVVIRHQERSVHDVLWSLQTSYYPMKLVHEGATRLLDVKDMPEGVRHYLESDRGIKEIGSRDTMKVRAPNAGEAARFRIPDDGWIAVFETRQVGVDASHRPIRVTISIYPADRNQFSMKTGELADEA